MAAQEDREWPTFTSSDPGKDRLDLGDAGKKGGACLLVSVCGPLEIRFGWHRNDLIWLVALVDGQWAGTGDLPT